MKIILFCSVFLGLLMIFISCNKTAAPNPCLGVRYDIQYFKTESVGAMNNGTITITFPVGDSISYSLNNAAFQSSRAFNNLAPGNYLVTVQNLKGCTDTITIIIPNYGPKYALVRQIVNGFCGPCHLNGAQMGAANFDTDNSIINGWARIKARAVDGIPSFMPQLSQLTNVDKNKILDWINAGHRISD
jgi:hypothetical protein